MSAPTQQGPSRDRLEHIARELKAIGARAAEAEKTLSGAALHSVERRLWGDVDALGAELDSMERKSSRRLQSLRADDLVDRRA